MPSFAYRALSRIKKTTQMLCNIELYLNHRPCQRSCSGSRIEHPSRGVNCRKGNQSLNPHLFLSPFCPTPFFPCSFIDLRYLTLLNEFTELLFSQQPTPFLFAAFTSFSFLWHIRPPFSFYTKGTFCQCKYLFFLDFRTKLNIILVIKEAATWHSTYIPYSVPLKVSS